MLIMNKGLKTENTFVARLPGLILRAKLYLGFERLWQLLAPVAVVLLTYLALSWFGMFMLAPFWLRVPIILVLLIALILTVIPFFKFQFPDQKSALQRLDRDSNLPHNPVTAALDVQALGGQDLTSVALWKYHQQSANIILSKLSLAKPKPDLNKLDPKAIRIAALISAIAAFFVAGSDWQQRLLSGFDFESTVNASQQIRLDAWIDPPAYTGRAPVFLSQENLKPENLKPENLKQASEPYRILVPENSTLVIRATPPDNISFYIDGQLEKMELPETVSKPKQLAVEHRYAVKGKTTVKIKSGNRLLASFFVIAIPDAPPVVEFLSAERRPKPDMGDEVSSDQLVLKYRLKDDYGVVSGEAFGEAIADSSARIPRLLVPLPKMPLVTQGGMDTAVETETTIDLSGHPVAGGKIRLMLKVKDDSNQEAVSNTLEVTIPQKPFADPVAKALIEQRRNLIIYPEDRHRLGIALVGLLTEPDAFRTSTALFTGLRMAQTRLKTARTDAQIIDLADWLWQIALEQENGSLTSAEKALRAAQENLKQAIERGAPPEEIKRLSENMRKAMDRYMREFAQNNKRNPKGQKDPNAKMLSENDLAKILEKIEELTKQGKTADAQKMLEKLNEMLKNMQTAEGSAGGGKDQRKSDLQKKADELEEMTRDERALRDRTFREGQEFQRGDGQAEDQQGDSQENKGKQGNKQGKGKNNSKNSDEKMGNSLQNRQKRLGDQLGQLQNGLKGLGVEGEKSFEDAVNAMREAERALGEGQNGKAVEKQGKALEALRRGAQGLQQKLSELGENEGEGDKSGKRLGNKDLTDPLGRPFLDGKLQNEGGESNAKLRADGKGGGTIEERSRAVMEELRRRLGDLARPQTELEYIERLLRRN